VKFLIIWHALFTLNGTTSELLFGIGAVR